MVLFPPSNNSQPLMQKQINLHCTCTYQTESSNPTHCVASYIHLSCLLFFCVRVSPRDTQNINNHSHKAWFVLLRMLSFILDMFFVNNLWGKNIFIDWWLIDWFYIWSCEVICSFSYQIELLCDISQNRVLDTVPVLSRMFRNDNAFLLSFPYSQGGEGKKTWEWGGHCNFFFKTSHFVCRWQYTWSAN